MRKTQEGGVELCFLFLLLNVMNIYIRDKGPKIAESRPLTKPEGSGPRPNTPRVTCFKNIFSFDDGGPSGRVVGAMSCLKNFMSDYITVREKINPKFVRRFTQLFCRIDIRNLKITIKIDGFCIF